MKKKEVNIKILKKRAVSGVFSLSFLRLFLQGISFLGSVFLARLLTPEIFGVFAIVSFVITFFGFFSDIGLAAALIQKKKEPSQKDLKTTFVIQQCLVAILVFLAFLIAPFIARHYNLSTEGIWLIRVLIFSLVLTSLKTIPSILLERKLKFTKVVIPEAAEIISYHLLAVILAFFGFGVWSFVWAVIFRGIIGTGLMYWLSPWKPGFAFDKQAAKKLISFGLPYQSNYFLALIKDAVMPVFVGSVSGVAAVGYLNWALRFSTLPMIPIQIIFRVAFPAYARIQEDKILLKKALEKSLKLTNYCLFPTVFLLMATAPQIIHFVWTDKWQPGLLAFYIHSLGVLVTGITNTFYNAFWAIGKVRKAIIIMIISMVINWGTSIPLVYKMGFNGAMLGSVIVLYISLPLSIHFMKQIIDIKIWQNIQSALLASFVAGIAAFLLASFIIKDIFSLFLVLFAAGLFYILILWILEKGELEKEIKWLFIKTKRK